MSSISPDLLEWAIVEKENAKIEEYAQRIQEALIVPLGDNNIVDPIQKEAENELSYSGYQKLLSTFNGLI